MKRHRAPATGPSPDCLAKAERLVREGRVRQTSLQSFEVAGDTGVHMVGVHPGSHIEFTCSCQAWKEWRPWCSHSESVRIVLRNAVSKPTPAAAPAAWDEQTNPQSIRKPAVTVQPQPHRAVRTPDGRYVCGCPAALAGGGTDCRHTRELQRQDTAARKQPTLDGGAGQAAPQSPAPAVSEWYCRHCFRIESAIERPDCRCIRTPVSMWPLNGAHEKWAPRPQLHCIDCGQSIPRGQADWFDNVPKHKGRCPLPAVASCGCSLFEISGSCEHVEVA